MNVFTCVWSMANTSVHYDPTLELCNTTITQTVRTLAPDHASLHVEALLRCCRQQRASLQ